MEDRNTHPKDAAYPMNFEYTGEVDGIPSINTKTSFGLTKREYFAALAMQGLLTGIEQNATIYYHEVAKDAVIAADELINQLNKHP